MDNKLNKETSIAVIGLGYVGLPLAVELAKSYRVVGYDINQSRVSELTLGIDKTQEISSRDLASVQKNLTITADEMYLSDVNFYIVAVPTPVNKNHEPDLEGLLLSSELIGRYLSIGDIVVYESTVFPGCTEEICVPQLEAASGFTYNIEFFCGYSPERINPGDKEHTISNVVKIISGSDEQAINKIETVYSQVTKAGVYRARNIKTAEAAKVIENAQRDINIAFMNELSIIFNEMDINTRDVLEAAKTKWNFLHFNPGLVGGHCIGVDPYYLAWKAEKLGIKPQMILAGRNVNEYVAHRISTHLQKNIKNNYSEYRQTRILLMGYAFKENCNDIRNTQVEKIRSDLINMGFFVDVCDPVCCNSQDEKDYEILITEKPENSDYDAIIIAVAHDVFHEWGFEIIKSYLKPGGLIYDVKTMFPDQETDFRL